MDPILFKKMLDPIKNKYPILEILEKCYPLKGSWKWDMIDNMPQDILNLFKSIHMNNEPSKIGDGGTILPEWHVDADLKHPLYKKLFVFMNGEEELSESELSSESEIELSSSEEVVEIKTSKKIIRDGCWKNHHPLLNPRLEDDINSGFLIQPQGVNILPLIDEMLLLGDDEWLCVVGREKSLNPVNPIEELGMYGREKCLTSVKTLAFIKSLINNYSLDHQVNEYVGRLENRKNIWNWIQVGRGYWRDFEWMLVGNRDLITKTIHEVQGKMRPLQKRSSGSFKFDPETIFTAPDDMCLNITTGKLVKKTRNTDQYGWISDGPVDKLKVRGYIHNAFLKKYPKTIMPGKKDKWLKQLLSLIRDCSSGEYIDFDTCDKIKYSPITSKKYEFSKLFQFARSITSDYSLKEIEFYLGKL